jgi:ribonuclease PH
MAKTLRHDGRRANQLRATEFILDYVPTADGSCLVRTGATRVICTASFEPSVPEWMKGKGRGWVTAEYGMLPASTGRRKSRPIGKPDSRATEIQRLIGRVLRSVVRLDRLGENSIVLDCDVLTADGGTRTAAITGAYVALASVLAKLERKGAVKPGVLRGAVAAVSVGIVGGRCLLDLDYVEDSAADVDMNVAMTSGGRYVEIQGASERAPFTGGDLQRLLALARAGVRRLLAEQRRILKRA